MAEYIDREQVVQYLYNQAEALDEAGGSFMAAVHAQGWAGAIKKWPAADVAPVVHAHWVSGYSINCYGQIQPGIYVDWKTCSKCGAKNYEPRYFCPNCGAKMDEGAKL